MLSCSVNKNIYLVEGLVDRNADFQIPFYENYSFPFFYRFLFHIPRYIVYSFLGTLDIFIIYERIQTFKPTWKFLSKLSAYKISLGVFIFSILITFPINFGPEMDSQYLLSSSKPNWKFLSKLSSILL